MTGEAGIIVLLIHYLCFVSIWRFVLHPSNIPPTCKKSLQIGLNSGLSQATILFLISGKNQTFSGKNPRFLGASPSGWFHLVPLYSTRFYDDWLPQNPPLATAYRFESGHRHQSNIIRTSYSPLGMGSDLLFISQDTSKPISLMVGRYAPNPSHEDREERKSRNKTSESYRFIGSSRFLM